MYHFRELSHHKLQERWLGPFLVIDCDDNTLLLWTPADRHFHSLVNVSACKPYNFPPGEEPEILPASYIDRKTVEIGKIVGQRVCADDAWVIEYRCRLRYPSHDVPAHDMWFRKRAGLAGFVALLRKRLRARHFCRWHLCLWSIRRRQIACCRSSVIEASFYVFR